MMLNPVLFPLLFMALLRGANSYIIVIFIASVISDSISDTIIA
jgi:hypothetical protein